MEKFVLRLKGFTPDSLPIGRLGDYLAALSELVGKDSPVYFDRVTKGSAKLKVMTPPGEAHQVESRVRLSPTMDPSSDGRRGYDRIQKLLCEDNTSAEFRSENGAVILQFPGGRATSSVRTASIREYGELMGRVIRVGGKDSTIPVSLQLVDGDVVNCTATIDQARLLKAHLLEPTDILLTGVGRWTRDEQGQWTVSEFKISGFSPVTYEGFDSGLSEIKKTGSGWDSEHDFDAALHRIRYGI